MEDILNKDILMVNDKSELRKGDIILASIKDNGISVYAELLKDPYDEVDSPGEVVTKYEIGNFFIIESKGDEYRRVPLNKNSKIIEEDKVNLIPIKGMILSLLGFIPDERVKVYGRKTHETYKRYQHNIGYVLEHYDKVWRLTYPEDSNSNEARLVVEKLIYVHQLQHALRECEKMDER